MTLGERRSLIKEVLRASNFELIVKNMKIIHARPERALYLLRKWRGGLNDESILEEKWLTFHDRKWLNFKRPLTTDDMSRIYIRKFDAITELDDTKLYEFDVFSPDGYYLYRMRIPFLPQVIRNGFVYQVDSNLDTGEIKIIRFRVVNWDQIKTGIN